MEQLEQQELSEEVEDARLWELLSVPEQVQRDFYGGDDVELV